MVDTTLNSKVKTIQKQNKIISETQISNSYENYGKSTTHTYIRNYNKSLKEMSYKTYYKTYHDN